MWSIVVIIIIMIVMIVMIIIIIIIIIPYEDKLKLLSDSAYLPPRVDDLLIPSEDMLMLSRIPAANKSCGQKRSMLSESSHWRISQSRSNFFRYETARWSLGQHQCQRYEEVLASFLKVLDFWAVLAPDTDTVSSALKFWLRFNEFIERFPVHKSSSFDGKRKSYLPVSSVTMSYFKKFRYQKHVSIIIPIFFLASTGHIFLFHLESQQTMSKSSPWPPWPSGRRWDQQSWLTEIGRLGRLMDN